jgi:hypothetical protein
MNPGQNSGRSREISEHAGGAASPAGNVPQVRASPVSGKGGRIAGRLQQIFARLEARAEAYVSGRHWLWEACLLAVLFSVLCSSGIDNRLYEINVNYSSGYYQKIQHPLRDLTLGADPRDHDAKLNFRLTVPVLLHLLRVSPGEHWVLPALTAAAICGLIAVSCRFAFRVTRDRVCGLFIALAVASTYIGSFGFTFCYDAIAIFQLALAMLPGTPWLLRSLLVFTAAFTDERAFVAAPLLIVQGLCFSAGGPGLRARLFNPRCLAVMGGMAAYCVGRAALGWYAGLRTPLDEIGLARIAANAPFWHAGVWFALEGGWLLVGLAGLALWQRRQFPALVAFVLAMCLSLGAGFAVLDVLRSTSYVFPGLLVALAVVAENDEPRLVRVYCFLAFLISAVGGNYSVWLGRIDWYQPLAVNFIQRVLNLFLPHA